MSFSIGKLKAQNDFYNMRQRDRLKFTIKNGKEVNCEGREIKRDVNGNFLPGTAQGGHNLMGKQSRRKKHIAHRAKDALHTLYDWFENLSQDDMESVLGKWARANPKEFMYLLRTSFPTFSETKVSGEISLVPLVIVRQKDQIQDDGKFLDVSSVESEE